MYIAIGILLPWLLFFMLGRTAEGAVCLILQLTVMGWLPASIWALVTLYLTRPDRSTSSAKEHGK